MAAKRAPGALKKYLLALEMVDPDEARRLIKRAFVDARCSNKAAASVLDVKRDTLRVIAERLGLTEWMAEAEQIAIHQGWYHAYRPPKDKRLTGRSHHPPRTTMRQRAEPQVSSAA